RPGKAHRDPSQWDHAGDVPGRRPQDGRRVAHRRADRPPPGPRRDSRGTLRMDVGLYFDLRARPELAQDPARTYGFILEACEEADRSGIHEAWFTEHHSWADGYLPQPLTFAAAAAARTRKLRVGTSIVQAPLRQAIQIAEEAAVVDLVSQGR